MTSLRDRLARLVERSPTRAVAEDDRRGWFFLAAIQIGVSICVPLFALGGQLGRHARFMDLVPAVFAGALLSAFFGTLTGCGSFYQPGTWGPAEADILVAKAGGWSKVSAGSKEW